jgi:hypothetical protein
LQLLYLIHWFPDLVFNFAVTWSVGKFQLRDVVKDDLVGIVLGGHACEGICDTLLGVGILLNLPTRMSQILFMVALKSFETAKFTG